VAATRWIGFEGGASKSGDRIPLGGANTEDASCDLLLFALPGGQGLEVWKKICSEQALNDLPVAILTMQNQEMVRILDFAKDNSYLKQLGQAGSVAEIKNLLRGLKLSTSAKPPIEVAELVIDPFSHRVTREGRETTLSVLEFRLLYYLAIRPNRFFTRDHLYAAIWRGSRSINPRVVDVYIRRLRMKIEAEPDHPTYLKTLRGMGYLFDSTSGRLPRRGNFS
jgi:DNA-binding response OmpR family regulator